MNLPETPMENNKTKIDIPANMSAYFHLVFSHEKPIQIRNPIYCGVVNEKSNEFYSSQRNKHYRFQDLGSKTPRVSIAT